MQDFVEFDIVFNDKLFLVIHISCCMGDPHSYPVVAMRYHVVGTFNSHQEPENSIVVDKCLSIEYDLQRPVTLAKEKKMRLGSSFYLL